LPERTKENHDKTLGQPVSEPRFEPGTSRIRSRSVNHSNTTIDEILMKLYVKGRRKSVIFYWKQGRGNIIIVISTARS
jgi:hypothetical protein